LTFRTPSNSSRVSGFPSLRSNVAGVVGRQLLRPFVLILGVPVGVRVGREDPVYLPVLDGEVEPLGLSLQVEAIASFNSAAISSVQPTGVLPWYRSAGEAGSRSRRVRSRAVSLRCHLEVPRPAAEPLHRMTEVRENAGRAAIAVAALAG
jgi:hypothetical protein